MAYRIKEWENPAQAVTRIVDEQLARAADQLEGRGDPDRDEAVHDARKCLKKSRSALRLARDDLGNARRREENVLLRDAGRELSGVRDAQVLIETLATFEDDLPRRAYGALADDLVRHREELVAVTGSEGGSAQRVAGEVRSMRERVPEWPLDDTGFASLESGLRRIHERGRAAMVEAVGRGGDEAWHTWRKRVKDLWYSLRIVEPLAPAQLEGMVAEADRLSDVLGDHNDLAVLADALEARAGLLDEKELRRLRRALERRREKLRRASFPLGKRLYAERPQAFARRVAAYWRAREASRLAQARWVSAADVDRIRQLLTDKQHTHGVERRRLGARLRWRGFRVSEYSPLVNGRPSHFGPEDFDLLLERGSIRVGRPPKPRRLARI